MRILSLSIFLFFISCTVKVNAQNNDVTYLIKVIKDSYAGYSDKVKGDEFDKFVTHVLKTEGTDTFRILAKIVSYFDNPHLNFSGIVYSNRIKTDSIECQRNLRDIRTFFAKSASIRDPKEGYWLNDKNTVVVAVRKIKSHPLTYHAYLIEARTPPIVPYGFPIAKMEQVENGKFLTDFVTPRGGVNTFIYTVFRNDSLFTTADFGKWKKIRSPYSVPLLPSLPLLGYLTYGKLLDSNNYLLTISDFTAPKIAVLDSIIKRDYKLITSAKNLIIDIRDNAGGTVRAYRPLFPLIYTNPISSISGYTYCSSEFLKYRTESLKEARNKTPIDSVILNFREKDFKKVKANLGKFVYDPGDTLVLDSVIIRPQNVGIIINYAVQSAGEIMLLDFMQSKKVKTFGEPTRGAIDYLNTFNILLPSGKYSLTVASYKRSIPKGQKPLDKTGITPQIHIGEEVSDWVDFVKKYYD